MNSLHCIAKPFSTRVAFGIVVGLCAFSGLGFGQEQEPSIQEMLWIADERAKWYHSGTGLSNQLPDVPVPPPADPNQEHNNEPELPPLDLELDYHGGSYLYEPFYDNTRLLPPGYSKPRPLTAFQEFLGADMIAPPPNGDGFDFAHEPRFVGYGSYSLIGIGFDGNNPNLPPPRQRLTGIGHQLIVELDYRWTGTERVHVQFRPLGRENTGGSLLLLDGPVDYDDNSTLIPQRYWIEGELFSLIGNAGSSETKPRDYHFTVGKFPFLLHNALLINDELVGAVVNKNTLIIPPLSNMNVQLFSLYDDGEAFNVPQANFVGTHVSADYRHLFIELTLAGSFSKSTSRQAAYAAASVTRFWGPFTFAGRALGRFSDQGPNQQGGLFVLESNWTREFSHDFRDKTGWDYAVTYANLFYSNAGWQSMTGGNFNRLRSAFAVNPLVTLSQSPNPAEQYGVALGTQLFRNHEDTSFTPEVAFEEISGTPRGGIGGTYLTQLGRRTFLNLQGVSVWSNNTNLRQLGVFSSVIFVF